MSITGTISFRSLLVGRVEGFVESSGLAPLITSKSITELVSAVTNYTEEGQNFTPAIYISNNITSLLKLIPGSFHIPIGEFSEFSGSLCGALKKCAPLATGGWCIYVTEDEKIVKYGLFSDSQFPLNVPIDESLLNLANGSLKVIKIQQSAHSCVELSNHKGDRHTIFLSDKKESEASPRSYIHELTKSICNKTDSKHKAAIQTLLEKSITEGLHASHGALIAVTSSNKFPACLKDGLILDHPLDFAELVAHAKENSLESCLKLNAFTKILRSMFNCDGIIVFTQDAKLVGYNCFIKPPSNALATTGGARKRAYGALKSKIGNGIVASFIRSQDGWSTLEKSNKLES